MEVCGRDEGSERGEKGGVLIKGMEMGGLGPSAWEGGWRFFCAVGRGGGDKYDYQKPY